MSSRPFKDQLYGEFAAIGRALANPHRLELLDLLAQGERSVEDLANEAALGLTNASAHLQVLRKVRLVESDKRGLFVYYRLAAPQVEALWRSLRELGAARLAEVERLAQAYLTDRDSLAAITKEELARLLAEGSVTVVDVRPWVEYRQGHIAGARSLPLPELESRLAELSSDSQVVAYCRGPYCVMADEAAQLLRARGYSVRRLDEGFPEWRAAGFPVQSDARAA